MTVCILVFTSEPTCILDTLHVHKVFVGYNYFVGYTLSGIGLDDSGYWVGCLDYFGRVLILANRVLSTMYLKKKCSVVRSVCTFCISSSV